MRNITIKQLRSFVAVSQERSFTRAARRLLVSQSALTVGIKDLEAEIGMQLFDRTTRSVELTAQGRSFLPLAARLLDELSQGIEDLQALASRQRGSVIVTATSSFITVVLALGQGAGMHAMLDNHPRIGTVLPKPRYEVSTFSALLSVVESGAGIAAVSGITASRPLADHLVFRPLGRPTLLRQLSFIKRRGRSLTPAAKELAKRMLEQLATLKERKNLSVVASMEDACWEFQDS